MVLSLPAVFVLLVILLWRKFIYDKSASEMTINPRTVFTFSAKGGMSTTLSSHLALLV